MPDSALPPRVLIIWSDQYPRASLRVELLERGYDAVGAPSVGEAFAYRPNEAGRGPVKLILVEQRDVKAHRETLLSALRALHRDPPVLLLAHAGIPDLPGEWARIVRRPVSFGEIVDAIAAAVPMAGAAPPER